MKYRSDITLFSILYFLLFIIYLEAQPNTSPHLYRIKDSGGTLIREQAAYDVLFYKINMQIDPAGQSIVSSVKIKALSLDTLSVFVLDLDDRLTVDTVKWRGTVQTGSNLKFSRPNGRIWISLPYAMQKMDTITLEVVYHGKPKVSANPPWDDGLVWKKTTTGETWAGVACEEEGADVWWPCKDHPSDEADSVDLYFNVPANLTCVSNGRLLNVIDNGSTKTFHWYVSEPINNYDVTFYLGPYVKVPITYQSITGETIPSEYWFLSYNVENVKQYTPTFLKEIRFLEEVSGPFPFRGEKYGLVEAPYWGMEHQSAVAYGNNFVLNSYGFDYIHLHELAHEWWGNLVTAKDWSDIWIHEGFATYMEALFVDKFLGTNKYKSYLAKVRYSIRNSFPVSPKETQSASTMFSTNDIYNKGAWILHTLRNYLGDESFFQVLRKFTYPDIAMESMTNGKQCRLATTDEFLLIAEKWSSKKLDWFFDAYLRYKELPKLQYNVKNNELNLKWKTSSALAFSLPLNVKIGESIVKVEMNNGSGTVAIPAGTAYQIDPDTKILMDPPEIVSINDEVLPTSFSISVYPNPFNPVATIEYSIPFATQVTIKVFDLLGREINTLLEGNKDTGKYFLKWNAGNNPSGIYLVRIEAGDFVDVKKIVLLK